MAHRKSERVTIRLSLKDQKVLQNIGLSGDFEDTSTTLRFCVHFTNTILKILPASIGQSYLDTAEDTEKKEDE